MDTISSRVIALQHFITSNKDSAAAALHMAKTTTGETKHLSLICLYHFNVSTILFYRSTADITLQKKWTEELQEIMTLAQSAKNVWVELPPNLLEVAIIMSDAGQQISEQEFRTSGFQNLNFMIKDMNKLILTHCFQLKANPPNMNSRLPAPEDHPTATTATPVSPTATPALDPASTPDAAAPITVSPPDMAAPPDTAAPPNTAAPTDTAASPDMAAPPNAPPQVIAPVVIAPSDVIAPPDLLYVPPKSPATAASDPAQSAEVHPNESQVPGPQGLPCSPSKQ